MEPKQARQLRKLICAAAVFALLVALDRLRLFPFSGKMDRFAPILYALPYLMCGWSVIRKALLGIKNRQVFDESFLMMLATFGAVVTGEYAEAVAVMLFYQVGEWFQDYAVGKSRGAISGLLELVPESAHRERADGALETVDPDDVEIGDVLVIKPGERVPIDGVVLSGESMLNTAALTGEPVPRRVRAGEQILSGCINGEGLLRMRAEKAFEDSTVSKILEMVESASEKKSRTERFITRFARVYTPAVVIAALLLAVIPSIVTGAWSVWLYRACEFLVISCPCALVISVPLAFFGGIGAASRQGVLVKGSKDLELLAQMDTLVSDKTGTLTEGSFRVSDVRPAPGVTREALLCGAAMAEGLSNHPIALSIREQLAQEFPDVTLDMKLVEKVDDIPGQGIDAQVRGGRLLVGNEALMRANGIAYTPADDAAATVCYAARDGSFLGAILIRDRVKPEAKQTLDALRGAGVRRIVMLTGDRKSVGEAVGRELGVDETFAELLPQDKVACVETLLTDGAGGKVAFVGDGINDAPVLMRADVGIAMGSLGSDAAIEAADVVIMDDNLGKLPSVMRTARRTVAIARQNIVFALAVKLAILLISALGRAGMWTAVFADVGVAVLCILNSMRLLRRESGSGANDDKK